MNILVPPLYEARVSDWLRHDLMCKAGLHRVTYEQCDEAARNLRCPSFEAHVGVSDAAFDALRMARFRMGHLRYGQRGRSFTDVPRSICERLEAYGRDHNAEHLVDAYNLCEVEWVFPGRGGTKWTSDARDLLDVYAAASSVCYYDRFGERSELVAAARWALWEYLAGNAQLTPVDDGLHAEEAPC